MQRFVTDENKKWFTLGAVSVGLFMIMLDNTVVNVALPSIRSSLNMGIEGLEWVVAGYALTFAAFMLIGGKLADFLGRRLIFMIGLAVFTAASLACGLAPNGSFLDRRAHRPGPRRRADEPGDSLDHHGDLRAARARQGDRHLGRRLRAGARDRPARRRPADGARELELDLLHQRADRRARPLHGSCSSSRRRATSRRDQRLDVPGLATSAIGLFSLTFAFIEANKYGWTSWQILGAFAVAAVSLVTFVLLEKHQRAPMLDLSLFRNRTFGGANAAMLFVGLAMFGTFFYVSLYMQNVLHYSPVEAGASFLPMTILIILIAPRAGALTDRVGSRWLVGGGMTLLALMLLYYSQLGADESFWALLPGLLLGGVGMGMTMTPGDGGGDERGRGRQGRRRFGGAELGPAGRRLARDRGHGLDRRVGQLAT